MKNKLLILGLIISSFFIQGCNKVESSNFESKMATQTPTPKNENISEKKIDFQGVSFAYNPQIFGEVENEEKDAQPLEMETDKPDENFPKHIEFYFGKDSSDKNRIAVIPIAEHKKMYALSKQLTESFDENHKNLRKVLADEKFRIKTEIPFIPFYDAHQTIVAKVKIIPFQNGKSVCFLTQYEQEITLINNKGIDYYCQGITDDEKYYLFAQFPLNISFLPNEEYPKEFEGYKLPEKTWNMSKEEETRYKNYISKLTERINKLSPKEFQPNLNELEKIISSVNIKK